jgi:hypothetical protein
MSCGEEIGKIVLRNAFHEICIVEKVEIVLAVTSGAKGGQMTSFVRRDCVL